MPLSLERSGNYTRGGIFSRLLPQVRPGQGILKQPRTHLSMELRDVRPLLRQVEELERDKGGVRLRKEGGVCPCLSGPRQQQAMSSQTPAPAAILSPIGNVPTVYTCWPTGPAMSSWESGDYHAQPGPSQGNILNWGDEKGWSPASGFRTKSRSNTTSLSCGLLPW